MLTKSGGGYFFDTVLEYRVWINPAGGGGDYYRAFASFEPALKYSKITPGAEEPLVLVRQLEWIDEPQTGMFETRSGERLTEWQVPWLKGSKRSGESIVRFLAEKRERK
jgi:putative acetyltransferase